ncbi:MAG TPA: DUF6130 family protein [Aliidongia sp.]|nr:DUF6130 family protein [Aliidongia sp.]
MTSRRPWSLVSLAPRFSAGLLGIGLVAVVADASAQTARDIRGASPLLAIENEPPPRLIVDSPLPEPLAAGRVFIQYRTENIRMLPVFGTGALQVSPRLGHIHVTVDDVPWHFADGSGETIILVGLPYDPHKVLIDLADPTHRVLTSEIVAFTIPESVAPAAPRPAKP